MKKHDQKWLASPNVTLGKSALIAALVTVLLAVLDSSFVGDVLESRVASPVDFAVRDALDRNPAISDRLRIYAVDDATFSALDSWVLSIDRWAKLLESFAAGQPSRIIVDGMFSKIVGEENLDEAITRLGGLDVPIVVGSFAVRNVISYRDELPRSIHGVEVPQGVLDGALWPDYQVSKGRLYGPDRQLDDARFTVGHFLYDGSGKVAPFLRIGSDRVLPHIALAGVEDLTISENRVLAGRQELATNSAGLLPVNFLEPLDVYRHSYSVLSALSRLENGRRQAVRQGDIVLVLPQLYTGNTDFKATPVGHIPGGFVIASLLNSILEKSWLKPIGQPFLLIAAGAFSAAMLASLLNPLWFALASILLLCGVAAAGTLTFAYFGFVFEWLLSCAAIVASGGIVFWDRMRVGEAKASYLRNSLSGALPEQELQAILKKPDLVRLDARERLVTVMFVDVVGFSVVAEKMEPRHAFESLKEILGRVGEIVHGHGGIIDKSLGDGMLCYFGYSFEENRSDPHHVENALKAAIEIQRSNVGVIVADWERKSTALPLRVGLNTTSCFLGDLGSHGRMEFTVVGNGVNFAKRLEDACEVHRVLVGHSTQEAAIKGGFDAEAFTERWIHIKHHHMPVQAFQFDPLRDRPELLAVAHRAFRRVAYVDRGEKRWNVGDNCRLRVSSQTFEHARIVNFSQSGMCVRVDEPIGHYAHQLLEVFSDTMSCEQILGRADIQELTAEVCWTYRESEGSYTVGLRYLELSMEKKSVLVGVLEELSHPAYAGSLLGTN